MKFLLKGMKYNFSTGSIFCRYRIEKHIYYPIRKHHGQIFEYKYSLGKRSIHVQNAKYPPSDKITLLVFQQNRLHDKIKIMISNRKF